MVWWVDKHDTEEEYKVCDKYNIQEDRLFQSVNVMFNFGEIFSDGYDIRSLSKSGVNIFNIDLTVHDDISYRIIMKAIIESYRLPEMYSEPFPNPVCVAVTMSINKPVPVDNEVDVIILKDVLYGREVTDFKKSIEDFKLSLLIWVSTPPAYNNIIDLIRVSQGIILDNSSLSEEYSNDVIQLCRKYKKTQFCLKPEVWEGDITYTGLKRKLLVVASEIVKTQADGIVIDGKNKTITHQTKVIRNIVEAMHLAEDGLDTEKELDFFRKQLQPPQLASMAVAFAASQAALKTQAAAIIILTSSGNTPRLVSFSAPPCVILGITKREAAVKKMQLFRKVIPLLYIGTESRVSNWLEECRKRVLFGTEFAARVGLFGDGAKLVVLAPSVDGFGYCDTFYIISVPFKCDKI